MQKIIEKIEELKTVQLNLLKEPKEKGFEQINIYTTEAKIKAYNDLLEIINNREIETISDGYHTFDELYFHRMILFSIICNQNIEKAWKSKLHADGTMYKNYFIVGIDTTKGQYSYHYHMEYWDHFENIKEIPNAPKWDGHLPKDITRLKSLILKLKEIEKNTEGH